MQEEIKKDTYDNHKQTKKGKTGAKKVGKTIGIIALVVGLGVGISQIPGIKDSSQSIAETKRAKSLVAAYTNEDKICFMPDTIMINQAYDAEFCDGKKLVEVLEDEGVKYCEILDEYYTKKELEIAILTIEATYKEEAEDVKFEYNENVVYMPQVAESTIEYITKIVPKSATGDYSEVTVEGASEVKVIDVKEVTTKPYSEIIDQSLICDVKDGATLDKEGQTVAKLTLVEKTK